MSGKNQELKETKSNLRIQKESFAARKRKGDFATTPKFENKRVNKRKHKKDFPIFFLFPFTLATLQVWFGSAIVLPRLTFSVSL